MQSVISLLVLVIFAICGNVEAQASYDPYHYSNYYYPEQNTFFRSAGAGSPNPSFGSNPLEIQKKLLESEPRTFFTVTLTIQTSTTYSTYTSTTVCTTSTSALKVCTPSGRRRRSVVGGRGLFYSEQDAQAEEGSIFLPSPIKVEDPETKIEKREVNDNVRGTVVPFVPQAGFSLPNGAPPGSGRFMLSFGTTTTTITTTTTYINSLTAICLSTTAYQLCGTTGK